jgi:hypothetical protein
MERDAMWGVRGFVVYSLWCVLLLANPSGKVSGAEPQNYAEAVAEYRKNIEALLPFSVEWTTSSRELKAAFGKDKEALDYLESVASTSGVPLETLEGFAPFAEDLNRVRQRLSPQEQKFRLSTKVQRQFFWTDGTRIQIRKSQQSREHERPLDEGLGEPTTERLASDFSKVNVYSYVPDRSPKLRRWLGRSRDGGLGGAVSSKDVNRLLLCSYPPVGKMLEGIARDYLQSGADRWIDLPLSVSRLDRGGATEGTDMVVLRGAYIGKPDQRIDRVTVWLSRDKGYLPVRTERSFSGGTLQVDPDPQFPVRLIEVVEVGAYTKYGESYYPHLITTTTYDTDYDWKALQTDPITFATEVPMVPVQIHEEVVLRFKPHRGQSDAAIRLQFPVDTVYRDDDTNKWHVERAVTASDER